MKKLLSLLISLGGLLFISPLEAVEGISMVTRVIYPETAVNGVPVKIANTSGNDFLLQIWLRQLNPKDYHAGNKTRDFLVTPPLNRLDNGAEQVVKLVRIGGNLPKDRESLFFLATKMIPEQIKIPQIPQKATPKLQVVMTYNIPVFYRPKALAKKGIKSAIKQLTANWQGHDLQLDNPSPFYFQLAHILLGNQSVNIQQQPWLLPFSQTHYSLNKASADKTLTLSAIDEKGYVTTAKIEIANR